MKTLVVVATSLFILSACKSASKHDSGGAAASPLATTTVTSNAPVEMRLKGKLGEVTKTFYHSDSAVEDYEERQKVRDHEEMMDFLVSTEVIASKEQQFTARTKTLKKDGAGSLHDFAFPEPEEYIDFVYSRDARVLSAEPFSKESIFFMPPVSLPEGKAKVGDTWTMDHAWVSSSDGLPLNLNMVTIFKNLIPCGPYGRCADLEVSGRVDVISAKMEALEHFDSRLWGRILFSLDKGDVIWSEIRSHEIFKTTENEVRVLSCMVSVMQSPNGAKPTAATCQATTKAVDLPNLKF